jgi:sortase (surface protein transpeptidase)
MSPSSTFGGRRGALAAVVTAVLLVLGGGLVARALTAPGPPPQPDSSQGKPAPTRSGSATSSPRTSPTTPAAQVPASDFGPIMVPSPPVGLRIPSIKVATKGLVDLGLDDKGELEAPKDFQQAGWYAAGPTPGEFGPSVIAAHVDSHLGPAVFYRLGSLKKGAKVMVERQDGSTATFVVDRVERYPKAQFPTSEVYADTGGRAELRLITCGGDIDQRSGHYVDNVVAYAHLVS